MISGLRRILPYTSGAMVLALLWCGWIFWERRQQSRDVAREAAEKQAQSDREILDQLGGDKLTILSFSATPAVVRRGELVRICYGVSNAKALKIEPGLEPVEPALSRCVDAHPKRDTEFVITATGPKGNTATESLKVLVR